MFDFGVRPELNEILNGVMVNLRNQIGLASDTQVRQCFYNYENEKGETIHCAVGWMIDQDLYNEDLESYVPPELPVNKQEYNPLIEAVEKSIGFELEPIEQYVLNMIQFWHDNFSSNIDRYLPIEHQNKYTVSNVPVKLIITDEQIENLIKTIKRRVKIWEEEQEEDNKHG